MSGSSVGKSNEPAIVFVYFGKQIPKYVLYNLRGMAKLFPTSEFTLITDNQKVRKKLLASNITSLILKDDTFERFGLNNQLQHDWHFRAGFWRKTLSRVLTVCEFQINVGRPVLHIEADVIVSSKFPIHDFTSIPKGVAFSMISGSLGIASLLYLRDKESSSHLLNYVLGQAQKNPSITDMSVLGQYKLDHPDKVFTLPHISGNNHPLYRELEKNAREMKGYFDPAQFGQYFFGIDERNSRGWRRLFDRELLPQVFSHQLRLKISKRRFLVYIENREYELFTLHIHAKDLRAFKAQSLTLLTYWRNMQFRMGIMAVPTKYIFRLKSNGLKHKMKILIKREY
jgi:hypothetical protein